MKFILKFYNFLPVCAISQYLEPYLGFCFKAWLKYSGFYTFWLISFLEYANLLIQKSIFFKLILKIFWKMHFSHWNYFTVVYNIRINNNVVCLPNNLDSIQFLCYWFFYYSVGNTFLQFFKHLSKIIFY